MLENHRHSKLVLLSTFPNSYSAALQPSLRLTIRTPYHCLVFVLSSTSSHQFPMTGKKGSTSCFKLVLEGRGENEDISAELLSRFLVPFAGPGVLLLCGYVDGFEDEGLDSNLGSGIDVVGWRDGKSVSALIAGRRAAPTAGDEYDPSSYPPPRPPS